MRDATKTYRCLNCGELESEIPLVGLRYQGDQFWICSSCLSLLIHHPQRLVGKLPGAENITGT